MSNIAKFQPQLPARCEDFLAARTPVQCMKLYSKVTTAIEAYNTQSTSLAALKKQYSPDWTQAYIAVWIVNINEFFNVSRPMSDSQVEETAFHILTIYYYLKISDITLIFNRAKRGEFGQLYESLDGSKILSWFEKYAVERMNSVLEYNSREDYKIKDIEKDAKRVSDTTDIKTAMKRAKGFELIEKAKKQ